MLSFEDLSVMLSFKQNIGIAKGALVANALHLHKSDKFDRSVALATIDKLVGFGFIARDMGQGLYYITTKGVAEVKSTRTSSQTIVDRMVFEL